MANLGTWTVNASTEYQLVSNIADITFTADKVYGIQILKHKQENTVYLRVGTEGKGFLIDDREKIEYTATVDDLYIYVNYGNCEINIEEK